MFEKNVLLKEYIKEIEGNYEKVAKIDGTEINTMKKQVIALEA